ncbi:MAG TPA: ABC transporter permease [Thermoleophilaceae bacterium]
MSAQATAAHARLGTRPWFPALLGLALALALFFLVLPVVAIFTHSSPSKLVSSLGDPASKDALRLSLETSAIAVAVIVVVGTPAAYLLATREFPAKQLVTTLIELPLVLPPAVAGIGLLASLGPGGFLGPALQRAGIPLTLNTAAVVVALTFVAAPFYLRQGQAAFGALDRSWLEASRTLGAGEGKTFARVAIPAAAPGLAAGLALAWGRALGEFGATLMFAGSFRGITQTAPLAIYGEFATDFDAALALSAVLVAVSGALLLTVKFLVGSGALGGAAR